ncbi:MAG: hypothetical protein R3308_07715 [Thiohalobacterales bacterium]|nr:hypothetical protein [Thiohalobacterales bacterium]
MSIRHWLRVEDADLGGVPHRLLVDEGRLQDVLACLESAGN